MQVVSPRFVFALGWAAFACAAAAQDNLPPPIPIPIQSQPRRIVLPNQSSRADIVAQTPEQVIGPTLAFDHDVKEYNAKAFEMYAPFTFYVTNVWTNDVTINNVKPSCGCTTAKLPAVPWVLHPGDSGAVEAKVNLAGKMGSITKTLTFFTSVGIRVATLKVNIPLPQSSTELSGADRKAAMALAAVDAQAIFKGDCARCHVDKGRDKLGEELYVADCGICHESSRRESVVPDLHALKQPTSFEYWKTIITAGKPHTMMPGWAMANGGPLTDQQVLSLAGYLSRVLARHAVLAPMTNAAAHPQRFTAQE